MNGKAILPVALWMGVISFTGGTAAATSDSEQRHSSYVLGPETAYRGKDVEEIARSIRRQSDLMLDAMASRDAAAIITFYVDNISYVGSGTIGDWKAIVGGTAAPYSQRKSVDCNWTNPFRIDVLARSVAVVTAKVDCTIVPISFAAHWHSVANSEVPPTSTLPNCSAARSAQSQRCVHRSE